MKLNLKKPLAIFDLETTGINVVTDKIVEISIAKVAISGEVETKTKRINPGMKIPLESSMVHGIYDEDVKDCPTFKQIAQSLADFLKGCDLGGFNCLKFDIPVLVEEFARVGVDFDLKNRRFVDAQRIYHQMEPRTLSAAYKFYCDQELENAHSAEADTLATLEVLKSQVEKYDGMVVKDKDGKEHVPIKNDMQHLHDLTGSHMVDFAGRMVFKEGVEVFNFGKNKGRPVTEVLHRDPSYYDWIMKSEFSQDTKRKLTEIKLRQFNNR